MSFIVGSAGCSFRDCDENCQGYLVASYGGVVIAVQGRNSLRSRHVCRQGFRVWDLVSPKIFAITEIEVETSGREGIASSATSYRNGFYAVVTV